MVPVIPVVETVRHLTGGESRTVNRDEYCLVQTPQVFDVELLKRAYKQSYTPAFTGTMPRWVEGFGRIRHPDRGQPREHQDNHAF